MTRFSLLLICLLSLSSNEYGSAQDDWEFQDIDGTLLRPFDDRATRGIALVFVSTDCPIANSYLPLLARLSDEYESAGLSFFLIYSQPDTSASQVIQHREDFAIKSPVVIDEHQAIARRAEATVTPEVVVYQRGEPSAFYQGRIDNRYASFGRKRREATTSELADALDALTSDRVLVTNRTEAVGCFISYSARTDNSR